MDVEGFDLVVIGSGPAGEKGAAQAAYHGKRVALVERAGRPGGATAMNAGIPTKTLRETALYVSGFRKRDIYGVTLDLDRREVFTRLHARAGAVSTAASAMVRENLERHGVELIVGTGRLTGGRRVRVAVDGGGERFVAADVVLLAPGSRPLRPANLPFDDPGVVDSETMVDVEQPFDHLVVLGAGAVGCEFASIFAALGIPVSLIDASERVAPFLDGELSEQLARSLERVGVEVRLLTSVTAVTRGRDTLEVHLDSGRRIETEKVLVAVGRVPSTADLGLEAVGIEADERGRIVVDETFRTTMEGVYAAGDVIGAGLASVSMEQARVAMCHAFGIPFKLSPDKGPPIGVYTIPEAASIGLSEEAAASLGIEYEVGRAAMTTNARAQIAGDMEGFVKLVFRRDDQRLLGVHILGQDAAELVHLGQAVLNLGGDIRYFIDATFNVPTRSYAYKYAAYDCLGRVDAWRAPDTAPGP